MAILDIITYPNPFLKKVSQPLAVNKSADGKNFIQMTAEHKKLASDMLETMYKAPGIGLSAVQVGTLIRLLVIDIRMPDRADMPSSPHSVNQEHLTVLEKQVTYPLIMFNPVILKRKNKTKYQEGCLSVPGIFETVERSAYIEVQGFDRDGQPFEVKTDGILSICFQHEIDHLDGKLFIDRLSFLKANHIRSQIKKLAEEQKKNIS